MAAVEAKNKSAPHLSPGQCQVFVGGGGGQNSDIVFWCPSYKASKGDGKGSNEGSYVLQGRLRTPPLGGCKGKKGFALLGFFKSKPSFIVELACLSSLAVLVFLGTSRQVFAPENYQKVLMFIATVIWRISFCRGIWGLCFYFSPQATTCRPISSHPSLSHATQKRPLVGDFHALQGPSRPMAVEQTVSSCVIIFGRLATSWGLILNPLP